MTPLATGGLALGLVSATAIAQCTTAWLPGEPLPGTNFNVGALTLHDPDGAGPQPHVLVLGGGFAIAGGVFADNLAAFDPATGAWSEFGGGVGSFGGVRDLASLPGGELIAAGDFPTIGGVAVNRIARWDGASWHPLGTGADGRVETVARLPSGDLLVGGGFTTAGGITANGIARWDGTQWHALGSGFGGTVNALVRRPNGNVVAAGRDILTGFGRVAEWDGATWSVLPTPPVAFFAIYTLVLLQNGDLVAGGILAAPGFGNVARWDGSSWSALGTGLDNIVSRLHVLPNGDLLAGGTFTDHVARWNGTSWGPLAAGPGIGVPNYMDFVGEFVRDAQGDIYCAGKFEIAGGLPATNIAVFDGAAWQPLSSGTRADVQAVHDHGGDLIVGGTFTHFGGIAAASVARLHGTGWSPLGAGVDGSVFAFATLPGGDLLVGGDFTRAGQVNATNIARWDGANFHAIPGATTAVVYDLYTAPNGDAFVGAGTNSQATISSVHRWDGTNWTELAGIQGVVFDQLLLPNGDLLAAGSVGVQQTITEIARWDGSQWQPFATFAGSPFAIVNALAWLPNGDLVAGGRFQSAQGVHAPNVARWDGAWHPLAGGLPDRVWRLEVLPSGELLGSVLGGAPGFLARWNGATWQGLPGPNGQVNSMTVLPDGAVAIGGPFDRAGDVVAANVARWQPSCAATVRAIAPACPSTGGPMRLLLTQRPWLGGRLDAQCTGMAPNALAAATIGFTSIHVPFGVGCTLVPNPDLCVLLVPVAGATAFSLPVPASPTLGGLPLDVQIVQVELGSFGNPVVANSSNALRAAIGSY